MYTRYRGRLGKPEVTHSRLPETNDRKLLGGSTALK